MAKKKRFRERTDKVTPTVHPNTYHIYTDGSYRPEGNAACAFLIFSERSKHVVSMQRFACRGMTINQMELEAINKALDHPNMDYVVIYSDSAYSISCLTLWRYGWAKNNWMTPLNQPVKNKDLIIEIGKKIDSKPFVRFVKVQAHSGNPFNSVVDYQVQDLSSRMRDNPYLHDGVFPC